MRDLFATTKFLSLIGKFIPKITTFGDWPNFVKIAYDIFRFDATHERDGHTHKHHMTA